MTIDLLPTIARLAGAELPERKIDGLDIGPLLTGEPGAKSPHEALFFYYLNNELQAVTSGRWKLLLPHTYRTLGGKPGGVGGVPVNYDNVKIEVPELYDLEADASETTNVAGQHPEIVERLLSLAETARVDLGDSLAKRVGQGVREPGQVADEP